ncbi:alpha/beta fold hydrolase [Deinococcus hopiensis]|uniref:alpha/beta fold hydrolase n=1 Tax=Deinococcus hopiensis TaxID=309885 RepID=UPI001BAF61FF|nr:alpha/beta hydrolase [Deinococcus hopiensis]
MSDRPWRGAGELIDGDLACAAPWGFDPRRITLTVLLVHGGQDRVVPSSHGRWLAARICSATLWTKPEGGHLPVLPSGEEARTWLAERAAAPQSS